VKKGRLGGKDFDQKMKREGDQDLIEAKEETPKKVGIGVRGKDFS